MPDGGTESLRDLLLARAQTAPDHPLYDDGDDRVTFAGLVDRAAARAGELHRAGVRPGDRVALVLTPGVTFAETFWALQLLGATPAAFDPRRLDAAARRLECARPAHVLTDDDVRTVPTGPAWTERVEIAPDALAFLQPTSGTSGAARAAMIEQRQILAMMHGLRSHIGPGDVIINWVPPWHDLGLVRLLIGAVYHGAACRILQPAVATIAAWLRAIAEHDSSVTAAPDFCFRLATRLVDPRTVDLASSLRFANNAGEPVRRSSIEAFEERFGVHGRVMPAYGLAEATVGVSVHLPGDEVRVDERGNVSCGSIVDVLEVRAGSGPDAPEEIRVRGGSVFAGYLDAPEETAEALRDGWLYTGDSGYLDEHGRLYVLGRRATLIKRGGVAIAPRELEEAAQSVPGLGVVAAVAVPGRNGADDVVTVVAETDAAGAVGEHEVVSAVAREVTAGVGFGPGRVLVVPRGTVPRTYNGKIRHDRLRDALAAGELG
jgi:fatty-acyl-CoA synthase